jgi:plasmid stabilization system protein ParE
MIRKRLKAVEGLVAHFEFVARRSPGAAARLVDAVERTLKSLEKMPRIGRPWGAAGTPRHRIRVRGVTGFDNYVLYYREIAGGVEWLAIRHAAQDEPENFDEG